MTKVIAVHSFKEGTGKTTLTANIAAVLAKNRRVGVMDLDLSEPGLHVLFGLKKSCIRTTIPAIFVVVSMVDQQDLVGTAVMVLLAETFEKPTFLTLNMIPPGVRIKDAIKVGQELSQLFRSRFLQAFEFQLDVINNLSRSVFVVDN